MWGYPMPKNKPQGLSIESAIADLNTLIFSLNNAVDMQYDEYLVEELINAQQKTHRLFQVLHGVAITAKDAELKKFLEQALKITEQLHQITQGAENKFPKPHEFMYKLTNSFEAMVNRNLSKTNQQRMRKAVSFVRAVEGVVHCCESMPYYWHHANKYEKVAMVLGATLLVGALALTIASPLSPVLAAMPIIGLAVVGCMTLGGILYAQAITNPKKQYENHAKVTETLGKLKELQESGVALKEELYPNNAPKANAKVFSEPRSSEPVRHEETQHRSKQRNNPDLPRSQ